MRESCKYGSVRGATSNGGPYRNRREFITLLGGAAAAWPLAARAQQAGKHAGASVSWIALRLTAESQRVQRPFVKRLARDSAISKAVTVAIEYRWAEATQRPDCRGAGRQRWRARNRQHIGARSAIAVALRRRSLIVSTGPGGEPDPIAGRNVTGWLSERDSGLTFSGAKRIELLREIAPRSPPFGGCWRMPSIPPPCWRMARACRQRPSTLGLRTRIF